MKVRRFIPLQIRSLLGAKWNHVVQFIKSRYVLKSNGITQSHRDTRGSARSIYNRRYRMTLRQWLVYHQHSIVFRNSTWMGVRMLKNPLDAWILQEIIFEVKPEVIVEIGSASGGSTLYFANLFDMLGMGKVISIDIDRSTYHVRHPRIIEITGDSSSPQVLEQVAALCRGQKVLVVHDGDHSKEQVLRELVAYAKFVTVGSYFIVEDGIVDLFRPIEMMWQRRPGPLVATEEFLAQNPHFEIDLERERYLLTYNPRGFLRRIR